MTTTLFLHTDYTKLGTSYQLSLPLNIEFEIPLIDPVRLVRFFTERMDLSALYRTYSHREKNQASPRQLLAIVVYAAMNGIFSSRKMEENCRRDLNFMYLLEGKHAPDHATYISDRRSVRPSHRPPNGGSLAITCAVCIKS